MKPTASPAATPPNPGHEASTPFHLGALRVRLLAVVALALSPLLALSAVQAVLEYRDATVSRRDRLASSAHRAADRVDTIIEGARPLLEALDGQEAVVRGGAACSRVLSNALLGIRQYNNAKRIAANGDVTCSAIALSESVNETRRGGVWFEELRGGADFSVSEVFHSAISDGDVVLAAIPVRTATDEFDGALALAIDVTALNQFIDTDLLPDDAAVALVDGRGDVISRLRDFPADHVPKPLLDDVLVQPDGLLLTDDAINRGHELLIAPLVGDDVFVVLTTPNPSLLSWASVDLIGTVLLPLFMWLIALAAVALASDRLVLQWLEYLGRIARLYGAGRFDVSPVRAAHAPQEIAELAATMRSMAENLKAREADLQESADQKAALLKEVHHRVKNNLQIIVSLFNIQISNAHDPATVAALEEARARVNALALVHRSLYEAEDLRQISLKPFFTELLEQLAAASGAARFNVTVESDIADARLSPEEAVPLALFLTEAVTNAFKHAFLDRSGGRLRVTLGQLNGAGRLRLDIEDDGGGFAADAEPGAASGVGSALMTGFARQLDAEIERDRSALGGARVTLEFDVDDARGT